MNAPNRILVAFLAMAGLLTCCGPTVAAAPEEVTASRILSLDDTDASTPPPVVTSVALRSQDQWLAAAGDDHVVRVYDLAADRLVWQLAGHTDWVRAVQFHPQDDLLVTAGDDRTIRVWSLPTGRIARTLHGANHSIYTLAISPDGALLAAAGDGRKLLLFDKNSTNPVRQLDCAAADVRATAFSPDGEYLVAAGRGGVLRVWDLAHAYASRDLTLPQKSRLRAIAFSPDGARLAVAGDGPEIHIFDVAAGKRLLSLPSRPGRVMSLTFCGADRLAAGTSDNAIRIWDLPGRREQLRLTGHIGTVAALACSSESGLLVSGSFDTTVRLWNVGSEPGDGFARNVPAPRGKP